MSALREEILAALSLACGQQAMPDDLVDCPRADFGSPIAFRLAKAARRAPQEIAAELASRIRPGGAILAVSAEGGYVNFTVDAQAVCKALLSGSPKRSPKPGRVILEHTSVNPTGPVHVGRIRNTVIGDCLRRILAYTGHDVETHYYVNDIGKQVAIIAAGIRQGVKPDEGLVEKYRAYSGREDYGIFFTYVRANRMYEEDPEFQRRVQSLIQAAESGDDSALGEITSAARKCLSGQLRTLERLGARFDVFDYESDGLRDGSVEDVVARIRGSRYYARGEPGEGLDLSEFGLGKRGGFSVLVRADGTSVYITRDVAYHLKKLRLGSRLINVLGEDHKLQFQELKTILERVMGVNAPLEAVHFSFVSFEGVKFSTRKGEIATVDELLDEAVAKAEVEAKARKIGDETTAAMIGNGAVRFHMVKTSPNKQITFRWEDALNFEGESAPYIQYAHARSCRILEKSQADPGKIGDVDYRVEDAEEKRLTMVLLKFDDVVDEAAAALRPDLLASYLLALASAYGGFYMKCPVLDSQEPVRNRRLLIVRAARDTLKEGLGLLGIEAPSRM